MNVSSTRTATDDAPFQRGIPVYLNVFVGRERELQALHELITHDRLVTISGPAGIGKTRLAVKLLHRIMPSWTDGIVFVDYSCSGDTTAPSAELARVIGIQPRGETPMDHLLVQYLSPRRLFLILDSCEHLLESVKHVVTVMLEECPEIRILATSRERLAVPGERLYHLHPLSLPTDLAGPEEQQHTAESEAVTLFAQRAACYRPDFSIDQSNRRLVTRICIRLDGIPLALELAAARLRMMSLRDLDEGLEDRFRMLAGGEAGRHESLRTAIDWSYRLLSNTEQLMFRRLSVFSGGFRRDAADEVAVTGVALMESIGQLIDKSLLYMSTDPDERTRYRMLDSIREYGLEQLRATDEFHETHTRHLHHYLRMAIEASQHVQSQHSSEWLDRLQCDHDNYLDALAWGKRHAYGQFVQLVTALGWYWQYRGDPFEGLSWLQAAMTGDDLDVPSLPIVLSATVLAAFVRDYKTAVRFARQGLQTARLLEEPAHTAHFELALGNLVLHGGPAGNRSEAKTHYAAAYSIYRASGDTARCIAALLNLSIVSLEMGEFDQAREWATEAMESVRSSGHMQFLGKALVRLGHVALLSDRDFEAEQLFQECLTREAEDSNINRTNNAQGICLLALSTIASRRGRYQRAARLAGASAAALARDTVKPTHPTRVLQAFEQCQQRAKRVLGSPRYQRLYEDGTTLSEPEVRELALDRLSESTGDNAAGLTRREMEVAELIATGLTNREIAARLMLSQRTVDAHVEHVRNKLGVRSRAQIVRWLMGRDNPQR